MSDEPTQALSPAVEKAMGHFRTGQKLVDEIKRLEAEVARMAAILDSLDVAFARPLGRRDDAPGWIVHNHHGLFVPVEHWRTEHGDWRDTPWSVGFRTDEEAREAIRAHQEDRGIPEHMTLTEGQREQLERALATATPRPRAACTDERSIDLECHPGHRLAVYLSRFGGKPDQPEYRQADVQFVNDMLTSTIYGVPAAELRKLGRFLVAYAKTLENEEGGES